MTRVFLGGSLKVSRLDPPVRERLDTIIARNFPVLVGDANGADRAFQRYLLDKAYSSVTVFHSGAECRNNLGHWPIHSVGVSQHLRGRDFYSQKDRAMADQATVGLMVWDGRSLGTLMNGYRLTSQRKPAVFYVAPQKAFAEFRHVSEWQRLVDRCDAGLKRKVQERIAHEALVERDDAPKPAAVA